MVKIRFHFAGQTKEVDAPSGESLLHIAEENEVPMESACGGNGFCTTCQCSVNAGMEHLSSRNDREENMGITEDPLRLGCQAVVEGEGEIEVEVLDA